jgi:hypothetical protein
MSDSVAERTSRSRLSTDSNCPKKVCVFLPK